MFNYIFMFIFLCIIIPQIYNYHEDARKRDIVILRTFLIYIKMMPFRAYFEKTDCIFKNGKNFNCLKWYGGNGICNTSLTIYFTYMKVISIYKTFVVQIVVIYIRFCYIMREYSGYKIHKNLRILPCIYHIYIL